MTALSATEKKLIFLLSGDIGDSPTPYADLAEAVGLTEAELIETVRLFTEKGLIRRFGATLWHQNSGFSANALAVFEIEPAEADELGRRVSALPFVSHCYLRKTAPGWPYNFYAMIHAESPERLAEQAQSLAEICAAPKWRLLKSLRELKKSSLRYFAEDC